jgi:hypothetical protein
MGRNAIIGVKEKPMLILNLSNGDSNRIPGTIYSG